MLASIFVCLLAIVAGQGCYLTRAHWKQGPHRSPRYDELRTVEAAFRGYSEYLVYITADLEATTSAVRPRGQATRPGTLFELRLPRVPAADYWNVKDGFRFSRDVLKPAESVPASVTGYEKMPVVDLRGEPLPERFDAMRKLAQTHEFALYLPFSSEDPVWSEDYIDNDMFLPPGTNATREGGKLMVEGIAIEDAFSEQFDPVRTLWGRSHRGIDFVIAAPLSEENPASRAAIHFSPYSVENETFVATGARAAFALKTPLYIVADTVLLPLYVIEGIAQGIMFVLLAMFYSSGAS